MLGLITKKVFLYLLRSVGVFLLHISGMLEMQLKDELKSYLPVFLFKDALDYAIYLLFFGFLALVGILSNNISTYTHYSSWIFGSFFGQ